MRIENTPQFERAFERLLNCDQNFYTLNTITQFYSKYKQIRLLVQENPLLGQREPILEGFKLEYRRIVIRPYFKIIYTIKGDTIYFADIWDTRRDPNNLKSRIPT